MTNLHANWNYPTAIQTGPGCSANLGSLCSDYQMRRPLLVTDPTLASLPMITTIIDQCAQHAVELTLFCDIKPNPTGRNIEDGIKSYTEGNHDGIIAIGGGSAIDTGKAIGVLAKQSCHLWDIEDIGNNWKRIDAQRIPPIIAIPTTAGTGSEVGRASVIVNEQQQRKVILFHPDMLPKQVFLDPLLTTSLPAQLTAATGMDALSHNLEAYCSPMHHPMATGIAVEGIRLIKNNLTTAVAEGTNIEARSHMLTASCMGATAFQRGLGAMHALAHPLGAVYDAHHGILNAILMPYVLIANREAINKNIGRLCQYLEIGSHFDDFVNFILDLRQTIAIPDTLKDIGIDSDQLDRIAHMAVADPSATTNPIAFSADDYKRILHHALTGKL